MTHFVLERFNDLPLEFDGDIIAEVSSKEEGVSKRWQEIRIYHTDTNRFVTEVVGRSVNDGEHDIIHIHTYKRPKDVHKGLERKEGSRRFYTDLALEALEIADEVVPGIDVDGLTERI